MKEVSHLPLFLYIKHMKNSLWSVKQQGRGFIYRLLYKLLDRCKTSLYHESFPEYLTKCLFIEEFTQLAKNWVSLFNFNFKCTHTFV